MPVLCSDHHIYVYLQVKNWELEESSHLWIISVYKLQMKYLIETIVTLNANNDRTKHMLQAFIDILAGHIVLYTVVKSTCSQLSLIQTCPD